MITKVTGDKPFQVMAETFCISPSNEGYTLQFSADGTSYSDLMVVDAGGNKTVTEQAVGTYYRCIGNATEVTVTSGMDCNTGGGGGTNVPAYDLDALQAATTEERKAFVDEVIKKVENKEPFYAAAKRGFYLHLNTVKIYDDYIDFIFVYFPTNLQKTEYIYEFLRDGSKASIYQKNARFFISEQSPTMFIDLTGELIHVNALFWWRYLTSNTSIGYALLGLPVVLWSNEYGVASRGAITSAQRLLETDENGNITENYFLITSEITYGDAIYDGVWKVTSDEVTKVSFTQRANTQTYTYNISTLLTQGTEAVAAFYADVTAKVTAGDISNFKFIWVDDSDENNYFYSEQVCYRWQKSDNWFVISFAVQDAPSKFRYVRLGQAGNTENEVA